MNRVGTESVATPSESPANSRGSIQLRNLLCPTASLICCLSSPHCSKVICPVPLLCSGPPGQMPGDRSNPAIRDGEQKPPGPPTAGPVAEGCAFAHCTLMKAHRGAARPKAAGVPSSKCHQTRPRSEKCSCLASRGSVTADMLAMACPPKRESPQDVSNAARVQTTHHCA